MRAPGPLLRRLLLVLAVLVAGAGTAVAVARPVAVAATPRLLIFPDPAPPATDPPATTGPAPATTADTTPAGPAPAPTADPTLQPCFGAAAVDPLKPCDNPGLSLTVFPAPANARSAQKAQRCEHREFSADGLLDVCFFGARPEVATRTVALLGDSHAAHWRAALDTVLEAHHWRAISIQRAGCPLTLAHPNLPGRTRQARCMQWNRAVLRWIAAHPEVSVVFTSQHRGTALPARPGQSPGAARLEGYELAWTKLLLHGVRHIVVIRDTPRNSGRTIPCIEHAVAAGQVPGQVCALTQAYALPPDPSVLAAKALGSTQVQVADLATFFCRRRMCPPVTGGALILRDVSHMTTTYSASLGPYLLRTVDELMQSWPDGADGTLAAAAARRTR
ncbi:hypothetical protein NBH00_15145 [Paraconexibacter antarcticus]|uniref:SGNH domain-containing protein n=1 Tax=Paraconexibacter antarcticus TaxID=2949664 RepID=A0ABY5DQ32_9ACTN|nr:SGNH hydrolase domain-containing protein [Paraconexibacter antarcticus]UTI62694.1 hypothetical protein NBH00_15145 [Paraconexibacter antarcticus]